MTPFWIDNFPILYEKKYLFEILPYKTFNINRKLNSLLRLSIYYSIILYIINRNNNIIFIPIIISIITYIIYKKNNKFLGNNEYITSKLSNQELIEQINDECKIPTKESSNFN